MFVLHHLTCVCTCFKLMVPGVAGRNGLAAQRHVDLEIEAGQETVTTQRQLMEAETVWDQAMVLNFVPKNLVLQVNHKN